MSASRRLRTNNITLAMASLKIILILLGVTNVTCAAKISIFPIAGLFSKNTSYDTMSMFNENTPSDGNTFVGRAIIPQVTDTYSIALEVCKRTSTSDNENHGVIAIVDARPTYGICDTTCLLCNKLNIAHLSIGWEPTETMADDMYTFSYYPPLDLVSKAYAALIRDLGWERFTFFYEDDGSFVRLQQVIDTWSDLKYPITFRKLIPGGQNRETFKYIMKTAGISHHIMDCEVDNTVHYMKEIVDVDNTTRYQSFILTNLDAYSTLDLSSVPKMEANISTLFMTHEKIKIQTALIKDALKHLRGAITEMQRIEKEREETEENEEGTETEEGEYEDPPALCAKSAEAEWNPWKHGEEFRNLLQEVNIGTGLTGHIEFDDKGRRKNIELYFAKMNNQSEFVYAGKWDSKSQVMEKNLYVKDRAETQSGVLTVISRIGLPYFDISTDENGEPEPVGYVVDLLTEIFRTIEKEDHVNFTLKFREVEDHEYGSQIEGTNKWNGIMGELMAHTADLGTCDLTITSDRNSVVDFSTPFMTTGISMLFKKQDPEDPDMFSFINPLSLDVWLYLATAYIVVSFIFLICARMSHSDWVNPHPCNQNPENLENIWSFYNCAWFSMGTIMTQGCDILPRGLGSRWIAGMWWFFAMIVTASYTANMSTFLSNSRRSNEIENAKDLSEQTKVSYGAVVNASTYTFFKNSQEPVYQKIWQVMHSATPSAFTESNAKGMERVLKNKDANYAFFMEATMIKYYTERNCKLKMVGPLLDSKAYGIAMPKNSGQKAHIDKAIIKLQQTGRLKELENLWWKPKNGTCDSTEEEEDDGSLQMKNTSGIFLVLGVGGILGFIVAIIDFVINAYKIAGREKVTLKEALKSEWNASLDPRTLAKPAAPPRSAQPSTGSPSPQRERSTSRAVSVLRAASSFINFDEIY